MSKAPGKDLRKYLPVRVIARAVGKNDPLVSTDKLGALPHEMKPFRSIIPTFMHGKKITFTDKQTESNNRIRRAIFPNVIYRYVYSRLLNMNIYARMTTTTLYQMERRGGFDEYILTSGAGRCDDDKALMYRRLIREAYKKKGGVIAEADTALLKAKYGSEYGRHLPKGEITNSNTRTQVAGPLSTAQFMRLALTHPTGGYYMKQDVFGPRGDFVTSPEISQMFGELIGVWLVAHWQQIGSPKKFNIVELGPGRGTLMSDLLRTVTQFDSFTRGINSVNLVEASPYLRAMQSKLLTGEDKDKDVRIGADNVVEEISDGFRINWHESLETVEYGLPILLVAHEFFDAMPIYQFHRANTGWREILVDVDESASSPHNFRLIQSPGETKASVTLLQDDRYLQFKEGSRIEVSPDSYTYAHKIGERIRQDGGFALIADYGKDIIMADSWRGIERHTFVSPLARPGDVDLTADVDFSFLRKAFKDAGTTSSVLLSQGEFLRSMGIVQRLQVLLKVADADKRKELSQSYERLVGGSGTNGMGDIYKFLAVTRTGDASPYPFASMSRCFMDSEEFFEIDRTVEVVLKGSYKNVALQFPDSLLPYATDVALILQNRVNGSAASGSFAGCTFYILADTTYGSCCVDEVAAEHVHADLVVHYGRTCLSRTARIPVLYVFGNPAVDIKHCVSEVSRLVPVGTPVLLMYDALYNHASTAIFEALKSDGYIDAILSKIDTEVGIVTVPSELKDENHSYGRKYVIPNGRTIEEYTIVFVGEASLTLTNIVMTHNNIRTVSYNPVARIAQEENTFVNKLLKRRYVMVQKAKDAEVIGIVVGTLGVVSYLPLINHIKRLIEAAKKKSYMIAVGKPSPAKLANFPEIEAFVLVACPENTLVDSRDFMQPIVTPFELELALVPGREWTGEYETDIAVLVKRISLETDDMVAGAVSSDEEPRFSLVTGGYKSRRHVNATETKETADIADGVVQLRAQAGELSTFVMSSAAGEYLNSKRTWKGVEVKQGETPVEAAVDGRAGIASGYSNEGRK
ncbi:Diphthamide biosynthesis protein 2 [Entophlyctis luteolus]|nr:Diphthamide biosynthesis protein 2 [Entophlyctis luteolus]